MTTDASTDISLADALQTLARDEVTALLDALADTRAPHRGVHEARKAIRRLRSLLLLGRKPFDDQGVAIDAALKTLATSLSALRDAHVAAETASKVRRSHDDDANRERWAKLRRQLAGRRDTVLAADRAADPAFAERRAETTTLGTTIDALPWHAIDARAVRKALKRSLRRIERAQDAAMAPRSTLEQRHRWRRRLRRLRMQWSALKSLRKAHDGAVSDELDTLLTWLKERTASFSTLSRASDALGHEQDLRLLQQALRGVTSGEPARVAGNTLRRLRTDAARKRWKPASG